MLETRKILNARGEEINATDFRGVTFRTSAERLLAGIPPIDFIWRHWIPRGRVVVVAGAGGVGKSSLLTGLAVARGLGLRYFLDIPIAAGATLIALGEDYVTDAERRIAAWLDFLCDGNPSPEQAAQVSRMVNLMMLTGTETRLVKRPKRDFIPDMETALGIATEVRELDPRPDLVYVETVARFGGDESNQSHAAMISACETITEESDAAVSLVSHTGKSNARDGAFDAYAARGGSALVDNARGTIVFGRMPPDRKTQKLVIGREALPDERDHFVLKLTRATHSPPQDPIILKPISHLDQLVLKRADAVSPAVLTHRRNGRNLILQNAVAALVKLGKVPSQNALRSNLGLLGKAITIRDVADAVKEAIEDGALILGEKGKRGHQPLLIGPWKPNGVPAPKVIETTDFELIVPFGDGGLH